MRLPILVALGFLTMILVAAGFFLGRYHARSSTESVAGPRFRLKEEMLILSSDGEPQGKLPSGTVIYLVPDPFGDRTSLFKVYFETDVDDMGPIEEIRGEPSHRHELERYWLKSREWLGSLTEEEAPAGDAAVDPKP